MLPVACKFKFYFLKTGSHFSSQEGIRVVYGGAHSGLLGTSELSA